MSTQTHEDAPERAPASTNGTGAPHAALTGDREALEHLSGAVDPRTLHILERRRKTAIIRRRGWLVRRMLLIADLVGLSLAFVITRLAYGGDAGFVSYSAEALIFGLSLPAWILLAKIYGLYERDEERTDHTTSDDLAGVFHLVTVGVWLAVSVAWVTDFAKPSIDKVLLFWLASILLVTTARAAARWFSRRRLTYLQNTVIVGSGAVGQLIARKFLSHPEYGINLIGFVDHDRQAPDDDLARDLPLLGSPDRLPALVRLFDLERVVIAFSPDSHDESIDLISSLKDLDVQVDIVPRLFEVVGPKVDVHAVEGLPLIGLPPLRLAPSSLFVKRTLDIVSASALLVVTLPVMLLIALAVRLDSRGPALFRSERIGHDRKRFFLLKFRTMREGAEEEFERLLEDPELREEFERTHKLAEDPRTTRVGRFLRRSSLDELPQLVNVLRGDLSLVGPRPITTEEYARLEGLRAVGRPRRRDPLSDSLLRPRISGYWEIEHLRPGITGYWQIVGRSAVSYAERTRLDAAYVTSWSLKLDLQILAKTFRALSASRGAY